MAQVKLTTLFEFEQDIELAEACPHCRAELRGDDAIRVWRWVDEGRAARLPRPSDDATDVCGGVFYDWQRNSDIRSGDSTIDYVAYWCKECDRPLAESACWDLNTNAGGDDGADARLEEHEDEAALDCGCILKRDPVSVTFCRLHRGIMPYATRLRRGQL
jgi:hypothetical protein